MNTDPCVEMLNLIVMYNFLRNMIRCNAYMNVKLFCFYRLVVCSVFLSKNGQDNIANSVSMHKTDLHQQTFVQKSERQVAVWRRYSSGMTLGVSLQTGTQEENDEAEVFKSLLEATDHGRR